MTVTTDSKVYYDMYDRDIYASPFDTYRRLRDESPIYYNSQYDFWAVSRHEDVLKVILDPETYISGRGMTYNVVDAAGPVWPAVLAG